jgi:hypothetical protein
MILPAFEEVVFFVVEVVFLAVVLLEDDLVVFAFFAAFAPAAIALSTAELLLEDDFFEVDFFVVDFLVVVLPGRGMPAMEVTFFLDFFCVSPDNASEICLNVSPKIDEISSLSSAIALSSNICFSYIPDSINLRNNRQLNIIL